ncbi:MAG: hypothetical protein KC493_01760 [Bacteriovoracaceae bacterium]|nr:hypothetical protein [Bacteriovoracaceae bacterium]
MKSMLLSTILFVLCLNNSHGEESPHILNRVYSGMTKNSLNLYSKRYEFRGWKQKDSGSTTQLESNCGVVTEFKLLNYHRRSGVYISIYNSSGEDFFYDIQKIRMNFGDGKSRIPLLKGNHHVVEVKDHWMLRAYAKFVDQSDFKGQTELEVVVPLLNKKGDVTCEVKTKYVRDEKVIERVEDYLVLPKLEFGVLVGVNLTSSSSIDQVFKKNGSSYSVELAFYPHSFHGFFLGFSGDEESNHLNTSLGSRLDDRGETDIQTNQYVVGYRQRRNITDHFWLVYSLGWQYVSLEDWNIDIGNYKRDVHRMDTAIQRLGLRYIPNLNSSKIVYSITFGLNQTIIPTTRIADQKIKGHRVNAFGEFTFGW